MDISIIIVNYKTPKLTIKAVHSVQKYTTKLSYEIIVIDNNSQDDSIELLKNTISGVTLIENKENIGFGRANNIGIDIAKGKYIFLLNSDAYLLNDAIIEFYQFMEKPQNAGVGVVGGRLVNEDNIDINSYGSLPTVWGTFLSIGFFILCRKYYNEKVVAGISSHSNDIVKKVGYINGADMFIRADALNKSGSFDPDFFLYYEEAELTNRIEQAGYSSILLPYITLVHIGSGSQKSDNFNYNNYSHYSRGRKLYFIKSKGKLRTFFNDIFLLLSEVTMHITGKRKGSLLKKLNIIVTS